MDITQQTKVKQLIIDNHPDRKEELLDELERYISTNNARNSSRMTFVNLSNEIKTAIIRTKTSVVGQFKK